MKKFFIAICFVLFAFDSVDAHITPIGDYRGSLKKSPNNTTAQVKVVDYDEFSSFLEKQLKKAHVASPQTLHSSNTSRGKSRIEIEKEKQNNKSIFEKIYDSAMARATKAAIPQKNDVVTNEVSVASVGKQKKQWQNPQVPSIMIPLPPHGRKAKVPAQEHIPYSMTVLEVLNNGLTKIKETVVVLANGKKLKSDLTKILPLAIYDGNKKQMLDYSIISVTRNDEYVDYKLSSDGKNVYMTSKDNDPLSPGVYTYNFEYLVDNMLIERNGEYITYWNVGGNGWNFIIDRLGATLLLPEKNALIEQQVFFGTDDNLYRDGVSVKRNGLLGISFVSARPLFIGEGMYIVAKIYKNAIYPFGLWQRFLHLFYNHGDVILSGIGFIFIGFCLWLAWRYIKLQRKLQKVTLPKTALFMRALFFDKFDLKAVGGFLLEMYKKNIIDIQQAGSTILLIKRTDNLQNLPKIEQEALDQLFPGHETIFNVNSNTKLMFNRFIKKLKARVKRQLTDFTFKINFGYAIINTAMLLLIEAIIAFFKISSAYVFIVLSGVTLVTIIAMAFWNWQQSKWWKLFVRLLIIDICSVGAIVMSTVVTPLTVGLIMATEIMIVTALHFYASRLGLIKYYIENIKQYRNGLISNADNIILGKNFVNYQAAVWALDLNEEIVPIKKEEYYKIPAIEAILAIVKN